MKNLIELPLGYYLVRTQAGFNKIAKDLIENNFDPATKILNHPKSYPSIVEFKWIYTGGRNDLSCTCTHVNQFKTEILQLMEIIKDA